MDGEVRTTKDKWVQYCIKVSDFNKIDKTKIAGIRIGEWNGTYYLDDIYFDIIYVQIAKFSTD
ncbi:MAG: hypothetical protein ACLRQF_13210 [Thomasclavelia ramosa]